MPSRRFLSQITKSVLRGSLKLSGQICLILFDLGETATQVFLDPYQSMGLSGKKLWIFNPSVKPKRKSVGSCVRRLIDQGMVEKKNNSIKLTEKGRKLIKRIVDKKRTLEKRWDGKYRVVIFDIPESKRKIRDWLREELYLLNYIQLQKSVFIGKYPLSQDIIADIRNFSVYDNVNYLLVDKIYDERKLKYLSL